MFNFNVFQEDEILDDILTMRDFPTTPFVIMLGKLSRERAFVKMVYVKSSL